ncbi:hypothetical protein DTO164E3_8014 [Paecilomyces variotii]|nr:hypothetical protein DTO032I3_8104 [Paecilomyces variotii]KAJ9193190.1 hypothetical protein DTO164E3_8014 [Paecilomyces variotii]KAJ9274941.1 hypothetical protein DTO021D3_8209 [Paecilomyces variotii]KAJ9339391.1 hypothetical protein DTO027B6_8045 [Paecilomyces variotii]KAJ9348850.1 hypothetical protein DTO027B9_7993 [Paecilomyces variotii]
MVEPNTSRSTDRSVSDVEQPPPDADSISPADNESRASAVISLAGSRPDDLLASNNAVHLAGMHRVQDNGRDWATGQLLPSLHIRTDFQGVRPITPVREVDTSLDSCLSATSLLHRTPSMRAVRGGAISSADSLSPASVLSSPLLAAIGDITPLPSPVGYLNSPWKTRGASHSLSRTSSGASRPGSSLSLRMSDSTQLLRPSSSRSSRAKLYPSLTEEEPSIPPRTEAESPTKHTRNRSLSEYVPPGRVPHVQPRPIAVSGTGPGSSVSRIHLPTQQNNLHREQYLGAQRGIAIPSARPPTPPRSTRDGFDSDNEPSGQVSATEQSGEIYSVRSVRSQQRRKYRKLRVLGQGTFSQVSLAARVESDEMMAPDDAGRPTQKLVAVKVIEYGPAGGADEERVEVSLKREVDILKSVNHPSLVQLKALGYDQKRALLVLDYCPGGDLFEFATSGPKQLGPALIRRVFAELIGAVRYLHSNYIVHRDIKLENVLVNLPAAAMQEISDWRTYNRAVVTLSDLGLSRRIPEPPESPLLHTRCGSEDYAAPEILMGQPYDGRSTDAWALGVLLYALMESRLPFDALPGTRGDPAKLRARTPHRIARCEWAWYRYADADGEWDPNKGKDLEGARECVEALLKRNTRRKGLDDIAKMEWVQDAIDVPGGLKRGDKEVP